MLSIIESIPAHYRIIKISKKAEKPHCCAVFALFVFCSGAVPLYSSHSQNTKSGSSFCQSLSVSGHTNSCIYTFFDTLRRPFGSLFVWIP